MAKFQNLHYRVWLARLMLLPSLLAFMGAGAVSPAPQAGAGQQTAADALARFRHERDLCNGGQSQQDRESCLREAAAVFAESRKSSPDADAGDLLRNSMERCKRLPPDDAGDCLARMRGQGTRSGSVAAGGIYRELVRPVPAASQPAAKP